MLILPVNISNALIALADQTWPNECCALIGGHVDQGVFIAQSFFELVNELQSPREFRSDPKSMFLAMKAIKNQNQTLIAVVHSHPSSRPKPSQKDWSEHLYSDAICLIAGKAENKAENGWQLAAWFKNFDQWQEITIRAENG